MVASLKARPRPKKIKAENSIPMDAKRSPCPTPLHRTGDIEKSSTERDRRPAEALA